MPGIRPGRQPLNGAVPLIRQFVLRQRVPASQVEASLVDFRPTHASLEVNRESGGRSEDRSPGGQLNKRRLSPESAGTGSMVSPGYRSPPNMAKTGCQNRRRLYVRGDVVATERGRRTPRARAFDREAAGAQQTVQLSTSCTGPARPAPPAARPPPTGVALRRRPHQQPVVGAVRMAWCRVGTRLSRRRRIGPGGAKETRRPVSVVRHHLGIKRQQGCPRRTAGEVVLNIGREGTCQHHPVGHHLTASEWRHPSGNRSGQGQAK